MYGSRVWRLMRGRRRGASPTPRAEGSLDEDGPRPRIRPSPVLLGLRPGAGAASRGVTFIDMQDGHRWSKWVELSSVDTALLLGGVLFAQSYYDGDDPREKKIREFARGHGGCCTGAEGEQIIREYFGLPETRKAPNQEQTEKPADDVIDLEAFF